MTEQKPPEKLSDQETQWWNLANERPSVVLEIGPSGGAEIAKLKNQFLTGDFNQSRYVGIDPDTIPFVSAKFILPVKARVGETDLSRFNGKVAEVWMKNIGSLMGKPQIIQAIENFLVPGGDVIILDNYTENIEREVASFKAAYEGKFKIEELNKTDAMKSFPFVQVALGSQSSYEPKIILKLTKKDISPMMDETIRASQ